MLHLLPPLGGLGSKPPAAEWQPDAAPPGMAALFALAEGAFGAGTATDPAVRNLVPGGVGGAVLAGAPTWVSGPYGPCVNFGNTPGSTSTNLIRLGLLGALTEGTIFVQCTFGSISSGANLTLVGCTFQTTGRVYIGSNNSGNAVFRLGGGAAQTSSGVVVAVGRPIVLALAFSGTTLDGYADGVKVVSGGAWSGTAGNAATNWDIGGVSGQAVGFNGQAHTYELFSRRLTDAEVAGRTADLIAGRYAAFRPRPLLLLPPAGAATPQGAVALALTLGLTAAGQAIPQGAAALAETLGLTVAGQPVAAGAAALALAFGITTAASPVAGGSAALALAFGVTAAAAPIATGAAALGLAFTTAAAGTPVASGAAALALSLDATVAASPVASGAASLALSLDATAAGTPIAGAAAALGLALDLAAAGVGVRTAAADLALVLDIEAAGAAIPPDGTGAASLALAFGVTATGQAMPPAPPPWRWRWRPPPPASRSRRAPPPPPSPSRPPPRARRSSPAPPPSRSSWRSTWPARRWPLGPTRPRRASMP
jgi:hypothetical protein